VDPELVDKRHRRDMNGNPCTSLDDTMLVQDAIREMPDGARVRITIEEVK